MTLADEYTLRAARGGSRPAREVVLAGCLPLVYNLATAAAPDGVDAERAVPEILRRVVAELDSVREPARLGPRVIALTLRHLRAARERELHALLWLAERGLVTESELVSVVESALDLPAAEVARARSAENPLAGTPLAVPPPHLAAQIPQLAAARSVVHRRVTAAVAGLVLVAAIGLAGVLATRASGQVTVVTASDSPAAVSVPPSVAATPAPVLRPAGRPPSFSGQLPAVPTVLSAADIGAIQQHGRVAGRDNGQSAEYGGRSIWVFADTVLRDPDGFLSNTATITSDLNASDGITLTAANAFVRPGNPGPTELIPRTRAEQDFEAAHAKSTGCTSAHDQYCGAAFAFWPGSVIADPARHRVLVFYDKLCRWGAGGTPCSGPLGKPLGSGVAALDMVTGTVTRLTARGTVPVASVEGPDPTMFFPASREYATDALVIDGSVYVYGACTLACRLARVPLGALTDRSSWEFFTGRDGEGVDRWSGHPGEAVDTIASGGAGGSVLWCPAMRAYLNFYLPYASGTLMFQIGGSPFGPWSSPYPLLITGPDGTSSNYAAFGHPEYAERDGMVQYISYYQASTGALRLVKIAFLS